MKLALALCLVLSSSVWHPAQTPTDRDLRQLRNELEAKIKKRELASLSIAVIHNGKTLWKESFGWADRERGIRATPQTIYSLASLSKSITASGFWLLAQRGKLSDGDAVVDRLKSASLTFRAGDPRDLKIRHLLNMEGGIPHQFDYFYDDERRSPPALTDQIARHGFIAFPPGTIHNYSNFSLAIVDQMIADVSGSAFPDFMRRNVFKPLRMNRTYTERPRLQIARGYDGKGNPLPTGYFLPRGGAGMYSTLDDLIRYGRLHLGRAGLLNRETLERLQSPDSKAPNPYYSSGWGVLPTADGRTSLLSNGAIAGTATTLLLVPSENLEIVVLTNTTVGNDFTDATAFRIAGLLLDGYSDAMKELFAKVEPIFGDTPFNPEGYEGRWIGSIKSGEKDIRVEFEVSPDGEIVVSLGKGRFEKLLRVHREQQAVVGDLAARLPISDLGQTPHSLNFRLIKSGRSLIGVVTAVSEDDRPRFYRPYFVELKRASALAWSGL